MMRRYYTSFSAAALWLVLVCTALSAQSSSTTANHLVLGPGDAIRIQVWQKPELSGEFEITSEGTVADPFYQDVRVAGVPVQTASDRIRAHLGQYESNPRVFVEPLFRVAVAGEVRRPDVLTLRPETTIAHAIVMAGGVTERGSLNRVRVIRDDGSTITVNLAQPRNELNQMAIRSGDQIIVARRVDVFRDYVAPIASVTAAIATISRYWLPILRGS